jgi:glutamate 5-kinase
MTLDALIQEASKLSPAERAELVDAMIILSNVDGIYNGDPTDKESRVIRVIDDEVINVSRYISTTRSNFGRGGMITKFSMARKVAGSGTPVHLANGTRENILVDIVEKKQDLVHTFFKPGRKASPVKKWLAYSEASVKGEIHINAGAKDSLLASRAVSLLPVGVTRITGEFMKGDLVKIIDPEGKNIGIGKSQYNLETALKKMGQKNQKPLVHYDYLYLKH